jgi:hypothetical protein
MFSIIMTLPLLSRRNLRSLREFIALGGVDRDGVCDSVTVGIFLGFL